MVVNAENVILAGHGVVEAAKQAGMKEVPVYVFEGTAEEQRLLLVADNELSRQAEDDSQELATLLAGIEDSYDDLLGTGWTKAELDELVGVIPADWTPADKEPDAEEKAIICPCCGWAWTP